MSALPCPFCGSDRLTMHADCVVCVDCSAAGPWIEGKMRTAERDRVATELWNERTGVVDDEPSIRLEEEPNDLGGIRMRLFYGAELVVNVTHLPEPFAATMRGALMLIGGMAKSDDLEADE